MPVTPANTISRAAALRALDAAVTERELMDSVTDLVLSLGGDFYHTFNSLHSRKGYPDLHIVLGQRELYVETKAQRGKPTPEQWYWLDLLAACGNETAVWRPSDMRTDTIVGVLRDGQRTDHRTSAEYVEWLAKAAGVRR